MSVTCSITYNDSGEETEIQCEKAIGYPDCGKETTLELCNENLESGVYKSETCPRNKCPECEVLVDRSVQTTTKPKKSICPNCEYNIDKHLSPANRDIKVPEKKLKKDKKSIRPPIKDMGTDTLRRKVENAERLIDTCISPFSRWGSLNSDEKSMMQAMIEVGKKELKNR